MGEQLKIQLLGEVRVEHGERELSLRPRVQGLLAWLALHPAIAHSRDKLAASYWPESKQGQARTNLRNLLHRLREALPNDQRWLGVDTHTVTWSDDGVVVDVLELEAAIEVAEALEEGAAGWDTAVRDVVDRYRGELLPGHDDAWLGARRERLSRAYSEALDDLARRAEHEGDHATAIRWASQLIEHDPAQEIAHRLRVRAYAAAGDRAGALRAYHACADALGRELGVEPAPATRKLYSRLLDENENGALVDPPRMGSRPFVGRSEVWQTLVDNWQRVEGGEIRVAWVEGEAGIGKSRLAEEFRHWVTRRGAPSAFARCFEAGGRMALAPVAELLRTPTLGRGIARLDSVWRRELSRLLPELGADDPSLAAPGPLTEDWQKLRMYEAITRGALAAGRPLLLCVDDIQWIDEGSFAWLTTLARGAGGVMLLVTERTGEATRRAEPLAEADLVERILLPALSAAACAELVEQLAGAEEVSLDQQRQLFIETAGNPLFVVETLRDGWPSSQAPRAVPATLRAAIAARLQDLRPRARSLAELAAVVGQTCSFQLLARAAGLNEDEVATSLDALWRRGILRQSSGGYDFQHDRVRDVLLDELGPVQRERLHRTIADVLAEQLGSSGGPQSANLARHLELGGLSAAAASAYRDAADAARALYSFGEACQHLEHALHLSEDGVRGEVLEALGDTQVAAHDIDASLETFSAAARLVRDRGTLVRLQRKRGHALVVAQRFEEALEVLAEARQRLGEQDAAERIAIEVERLGALYWLGRSTDLVQARDALVSLVEEEADVVQRLVFNQYVLVSEHRRTRFQQTDRTRAAARDALAACLEHGDETKIAEARFLVGFDELHGRHLEESARVFRIAREAAAFTGYAWLELRVATYQAVLARLTGDVPATRSFIEAAERLAIAQGRSAYVAAAQGNRAWCELRAGGDDDAVRLAEAAVEAWEGSPVAYPFQWIARLVLVAAASLAAAASHAKQLVTPSQQLLPMEAALAAFAAHPTEQGRGALVAQARELGLL